MKWTGEDILAQLDEGWEIDEIAAATGMGIAEVKRLIREQRYKIRTQAKVETMTTTKQEETTQAEHPEWEWSSIRTLSMLPGAPPYGTLQYRFRSGTAQWAHYETAKPGDLEGVEADPRARTLGRLTPGTTWEPLEADQNEQPTKADEAPERETAKESAKIATLETALITAREEAAKHKATIERLVKENNALEQEIDRCCIVLGPEAVEPYDDLMLDEILAIHLGELRERIDKITEVLERHTGFTSEEISTDGICELIEAAFVDAGKLPSVRRELERVSENLLVVHRECERRGYGADDERPAVEKVREIIDAFGKLEVEHEKLVQNSNAQARNIALLEERTEELGRKLTRVQSDASKAGFLNEVLEAADEGNPWPALYRAAREVMR